MLETVSVGDKFEMFVNNYYMEKVSNIMIKYLHSDSVTNIMKLSSS